MFDISFPVAFVAGLISFFAPCVVPLIPAYIAYVTGVAVQDLQVPKSSLNKNKIVTAGLFYILGFSLIFVILGTAAAGVGYYLRHFNNEIRIIGGITILIFGLNISGVLNLSVLARERKFEVPEWVGRFAALRSFTLGVIFAFAWTPCVGAVLGSILSLAAIGQTAIKGAMLLFVYSLGISIPFLLVALSLSTISEKMPYIIQKAVFISKISGMVIAILGILLITDTYRILNAFMFKIAYMIGYQIN